MISLKNSKTANSNFILLSSYGWFRYKVLQSPVWAPRGSARRAPDQAEWTKPGFRVSLCASNLKWPVFRKPPALNATAIWFRNICLINFYFFLKGRTEIKERCWHRNYGANFLKPRADDACLRSAGFKAANATVSWGSDGNRLMESLRQFNSQKGDNLHWTGKSNVRDLWLLSCIWVAAFPQVQATALPMLSSPAQQIWRPLHTASLSVYMSASPPRAGRVEYLTSSHQQPPASHTNWVLKIGFGSSS